MLQKLRDNFTLDSIKNVNKYLFSAMLIKALTLNASAQTSTVTQPNVVTEPIKETVLKGELTDSLGSSETKKLLADSLLQTADVNESVLLDIIARYTEDNRFSLMPDQLNNVRSFLRNNADTLQDETIVGFTKILHDKDVTGLEDKVTPEIGRYLLTSYWPNGAFYNAYKSAYGKYVSFDKYFKLKTTENSFSYSEIKIRGPILNVLPTYADGANSPLVDQLAEKAPEVLTINEVYEMFGIDTEIMTFLVQENIASNRFNNDIISMLLETKHMREIDSMSTNEIKYFYGMLPDAHFYFCDEKSFSKKEYKAWIKNKERTTPTRKERNDYPFQPMFPTYPSLVLPATTHLKNSVQEREYLTVSDMYKGLYEKVGTMTQCTGTARRFMTKNDPAIEKAINEERIICRNSANGKEGMLANIDNPDKSIIGHVYNDNYYPFLDNNKSNNVTTRNKLSKGESVDRIRTISDKKRLIMPEGFEKTGLLFGLKDMEGNLVYVPTALGYLSSTGGSHHGHASGLVVMQNPNTGEHTLYINENYYNLSEFESKVIPFTTWYKDSQDYSSESSIRNWLKFTLIETSRDFRVEQNKWQPNKIDIESK